MDHTGHYKRVYVLPLLLTIILSGCSGGGTSIKYYLIDPVNNTAGSRDSGEQLSIEIMDVHVPQYLERFNLVTRGNENQLYIAEFHQWGDNFRKNLMRTLARNLTNLLDTNDVGTPVNRTMSVPDYRVQVHIEQFERNYDGKVMLIGWWQVTTLGSARPVSTHKAELSSSAFYAMDDYESIVNAMRELFGQLSSMIADTISENAEESE